MRAAPRARCRPLICEASEVAHRVATVTWTPGTRLSGWQDAEALALWHFREHLGYPDARQSPPGPDGGVDVLASLALAQVKYEKRAVGRPRLQQLSGARGERAEAQLVFYSASGYTKPALAYARRHDVALFRFDEHGEIHVSNDAAMLMLATAEGRYARAARSREVRPCPRTVGAALFLLLDPILIALVSPGLFELGMGALSLAVLPLAWVSFRRMREEANGRANETGSGAVLRQLFFPRRDGRPVQQGPSWAHRAVRLGVTTDRQLGVPPTVVFSARVRLPSRGRFGDHSRRDLELRRLQLMMGRAAGEVGQRRSGGPAHLKADLGSDI